MKKQAIFIIFMILMTGALATTIYIPEDYATIQGGINASENGDEIIVAPGTYVENINFAGKAVTLGSLFYTTQDPSYISQTIIDGNQDGCVVIFESEEDSTSVLTGFTITNGNAYNDGGGITCINYSCPSLENLTITGNSTYMHGGGIYCESSSPILENVTITDNSAWYGGGIYCSSSSPILDNMTITGNSAGSGGGGIYCSSSSPILENVTIAGNSAGSGGGVYCNGSSPSLENVTLTDNSAENYGGGVYCESSNPVFSSDNRCNIYLNNTNNRSNGSDIYCNTNMNVIVDTFTVLNPTDFHAAPIENFTFDILHGLQGQINADLYVSPSGDNTNTGLTIEDPLQTIQYACSVILASSQNLHTVYLAEGTYSPSTNSEFFPVDLPDFVSLCGASEIGVILNAQGTARVIKLRNVENAAISNLTITNGSAEYGGGICCESSSPSLENVTISNCSADTLGGGIYCWGNSNLDLANVTITDNWVRYWGGGGGIYCASSNLSLENVMITGNFTGSNSKGGGIYCAGSSLSLVNVTITGNRTGFDGNGGGIYCTNSSPSLENVTITDNRARQHGGGIYCNYSSPSLVNVTITGNSTGSDGYGGGIYCNESSPSLVNVTITDNSARHYGGGIYCNNSSPSFANVTITDNSAWYGGGGILCIDNSSPIIVNCIFWNNSPQEIEFWYDNDPNIITIAYSDIEGGEEGIETNNNGIVNWLEGNIDDDPLFVDAELGNYHLTEGSPCIDAGIAYFEYEGEVLVDLSEDEYFGIAPDMGAYEYGLVATDEFIIQNSKLKIQNFPNPFNPETNICFELFEAGNVLLEIYNIKGQKVTTLVNDHFESGSHKVTWNASGQSSGIYLLRFISDEKSEMKKLILLK